MTRKPLDFANTLTLEGSAQAEYSDLPHKMKPQLNGLFAWHDDSNHFGIMVQAFYEERDLLREGQEFLGYNTITSTLEPALVAAHPDLNNVLYPTLIGAALFQQHREREGGAATIQWKPTSTLNFVVSSFFSRLNASDTNNNYMSWVQNEIASQNNPTSYTVHNGTLVQAVFPHNGVDGVVEELDRSAWRRRRDLVRQRRRHVDAIVEPRGRLSGRLHQR